jgi:RNA polymerase sigma-70 factor (ECF subfamily)
MRAEAGQEQSLERARARQQLDRMLDALDEDKRTVFVLYELERLPMNDVAAACGCPVQTAYSRLHAARRELEILIANLNREHEREQP